jgi:hypothetical protein
MEIGISFSINYILVLFLGVTMKRLAAPLLGALLCLALIYPGAALSALLQPGDLEYVGAFRLPGASGGSSWEWSGGGLAYFPDGDPGGAGDGFPGSLFGIGHDWHNFVSEISIPAPIISAAKDPGQLNTAATLQPFADPRGGQAIPGDEYDFIRGDVAYLPARGAKAAASSTPPGASTITTNG